MVEYEKVLDVSKVHTKDYLGKPVEVKGLVTALENVGEKVPRGNSYEGIMDFGEQLLPIVYYTGYGKGALELLKSAIESKQPCTVKGVVKWDDHFEGKNKLEIRRVAYKGMESKEPDFEYVDCL
jgi:YesN/AraC family two-component response regulator